MRHPRPLTPADAPAFVDHLLRLSSDDRRLRFGAVQTDEQLLAYVRALSVLDAALFGVYANNMLIGAAELRWIRPEPSVGGEIGAELALSVDRPHRRCGLGGALVQRCVTFARNCGVARVRVFCATDNHAMRALLRSAAADGAVEGGEYAADFLLPPPNGFSLLHQGLQNGGAAAEAMFDTIGRLTATTSPGRAASRMLRR